MNKQQFSREAVRKYKVRFCYRNGGFILRLEEGLYTRPIAITNPYLKSTISSRNLTGIYKEPRGL
jgi:hypothetical protein